MYKSNLTNCYEIKELLKNILIELGFNVDENSSSKSDSEYLVITNWRNSIGSGNDDLYIRISNHDLPPTYSKNYYDFDLKSNYDVIYFQDEMIAKWKKKKHSKNNGKKCGNSFGRQIQSSYLGRVKEKLISLEKEGKSFKISKSLPTTKFCSNCGQLLTNITLNDRIFVCECGVNEDRDVHASKNVKLFGSTKRAEWLEQPSVEELTAICLNLSHSNKQVSPLKREKESFTL